MSLLLLEQRFFIHSELTHVSGYDFDFELHFQCDHPYLIEGTHTCVLRVGAIDDYEKVYADRLESGLKLVNSPDEHLLASELAHWYPHLKGMTPRTQIFETLPEAKVIEAAFDWPVFLKGSRQTSKHDPDLCVIRDRAHYELVCQQYRSDPILHWQQPVIREFVQLLPVPGDVPGKVRPSMEFRTFWWHGHCVGWGPYWSQCPSYTCDDISSGLQLADQAAQRLRVPFLVVDLAKTVNDQWLIIECNDAQEAGYTGAYPLQVWRHIIDMESSKERSLQLV